MKIFRKLNFDDSTITFLDYVENLITIGGTVSEKVDVDKKVLIRIIGVEDFIVDDVSAVSYHADSDNGEIVWISESGNHLSFVMQWVQGGHIPTKTSVFSFRFETVEISSSDPIRHAPLQRA